MSSGCYRGRLAPSPTGFLHLGHAQTFWIASQRALAHRGVLILRNEDLDRARCKPLFAAAMIEDLRWLGIHWQEGPDCGGPHAPYNQSQRHAFYRAAFEKLRAAGSLYPCTCSRQDVLRALQAPHAQDDEPIYPGTCRDRSPELVPSNGKVNWRFRIPLGERVAFVDGRLGPQQFAAGAEFGDFVVWRHDDTPSYQLAVVLDDAAMEVTEVVRGADLLKSTARQLLLYEALGLKPPLFYHCPLMTDSAGVRLAKRHDALSLRQLRAAGASPEAVIARFPSD
jgi:glutamyl-tRNA synthetase